MTTPPLPGPAVCPAAPHLLSHSAGPASASPAPAPTKRSVRPSSRRSPASSLGQAGAWRPVRAGPEWTWSLSRPGPQASQAFPGDSPGDMPSRMPRVTATAGRPPRPRDECQFLQEAFQPPPPLYFSPRPQDLGADAQHQPIPDLSGTWGPGQVGPTEGHCPEAATSWGCACVKHPGQANWGQKAD